MRLLDGHRLAFRCADGHESTVIGKAERSWFLGWSAVRRPCHSGASWEWVGACTERTSGNLQDGRRLRFREQRRRLTAPGPTMTPGRFSMPKGRGLGKINMELFYRFSAV